MSKLEKLAVVGLGIVMFGLLFVCGTTMSFLLSSIGVYNISFFVIFDVWLYYTVIGLTISFIGVLFMVGCIAGMILLEV